MESTFLKRRIVAGYPLSLSRSVWEDTFESASSCECGTLGDLVLSKLGYPLRLLFLGVLRGLLNSKVYGC